jgi:hemerythrin-like metal-binding protein
MELFAWTDKLKTGIPKIDEQHKRLIDLINELNEAMRLGKGKQVVEQVLIGLKEYTEYHFGFEVSALERNKYPKVEEQKKEHASYVSKLQELTLQHKRNELGISIDVMNFVSDWIRDHIMKEDMKYIPYLQGKTL